MNYSPLRYPGGKTKIAPLVSLIMEKAGIHNGTYIEPFAGGCGVALSLLLTNKVDRIVINDIDKTIYAFWYAVLNQTVELIQLINSTAVTVEEWKRQKTIFEDKDVSDTLSLGFATFFLNRTNRSGILKAGPIGGYAQTGNYLIDARYNKEDLIKRIFKISELRSQICLYNMEIKSFITEILPQYSQNSFAYFDPPYYEKGHELYTNFFSAEDHKDLCEMIKKLNIDWMVTYNNVEAIRKMYLGKEQKTYDLNYSLANKGKNTEIIVLNRDLWPSKTDVEALKINIR